MVKSESDFYTFFNHSWVTNLYMVVVGVLLRALGPNTHMYWAFIATLGFIAMCLLTSRVYVATSDRTRRNWTLAGAYGTWTMGIGLIGLIASYVV